ncbi:acyl-ACP--UDP-N-acetylglucosamine O-acyltransferase [Urbifossiella limnaea]|uniref:Acyl-[acyl-carrier-protein]--UDP-N-acetylglucosamine O-acyltransferase n=1 Tax=Urbifossiella limnaea TaxID=2528023 RepID=A0A517XRM0_9BACT|nr:acyl-ACP--UDP-N-acetylglucosamine O-acyltransferase [Urbifossiella limnaea]QDU20158.1 Acyl-[acyl-carrier-protein]--UDP-N-acetylglucosamine O-acyltransferase [Urbifossiella limnaea]
MPPLIHPSAVVSPDAQLAPDVRVGPLAVIDGQVELGPGCVVAAQARLTGPLTAGPNNTFDTGSVIGGAPQHTAYAGEPTRVVIGAGNTFREHVTVHRGMPTGAGPGTGVTTIGDGNLFMAGAHVAHDCVVGNHGIYANSALLGGHVTTGDRVFLSGNSAVHQFCRVGRLALLSGSSASSKDIPPFWVIQDVNHVCGVNVVGMRRAGVSNAEINAVRRVFRSIYVERLLIPVAMLRAEAQFGALPAVRELIDFVRDSKRGVTGPSGFRPDGEAA